MRPQASFPGKSPRLGRQHEDQHIIPKFNGPDYSAQNCFRSCQIDAESAWIDLANVKFRNSWERGGNKTLQTTERPGIQPKSSLTT